MMTFLGLLFLLAGIMCLVLSLTARLWLWLKVKPLAVSGPKAARPGLRERYAG